jgi:hypothetical protein
VVISSPDAFAAAVAGHRFVDVALEPAALESAMESIQDAGLLFVGESHGVRENPDVLYVLAVELGARAIALEWSHEEMQAPLDDFLVTGSFDFEALWSLAPTAEFFCGDGRISAGHFAVLERLRNEDRLDQVIAADRLDPDPLPDDWQLRDREMAARLLAEWDARLPLLVLVGGLHAELDAAEGVTMAMVVARECPGVQSAIIHYVHGSAWARGRAYDVAAEPLPQGPIVVRLPEATEAVVPGVRPAGG